MKKGAARSKQLPRLTLEFDREVDGRWIAEVPQLPGVMAYGSTKQGAARRVAAIALRTLADKVEHGKTAASISHLFEHEVAGH